MTLNPLHLYPVELRVSAKVIAGLDRLADRSGISRTAMAQRLFDAAYAARFIDVGDPVLEHAVGRKLQLNTTAPAAGPEDPYAPAPTSRLPGSDSAVPVASADVAPPPANCPAQGEAPAIARVTTSEPHPYGRETILVSGVKFPPALTAFQQRSIKTLYGMGAKPFDIAQQLKVPLVQVREFLAQRRK
jgi:hypothetical protein